MRMPGPLAVIAVCASVLLTGCRTYTPSFMPTFPPSPPSALQLYRALRPEPLPYGVRGGLVAAITQPASGYLPGEGLLIPVWPTPAGPRDGLYLLNPASGRMSPLAPLLPSNREHVVTASALGQGYFAYQAGPESGPRRAPLQLDTLAAHQLTLAMPRGTASAIYTSLAFAAGYLDFIATRSRGENDVTSAVSCALPKGPCRVLQSEHSSRTGLDVIALAPRGKRVYIALKPADPEDATQGMIAWVGQSGGKLHVLERTTGIPTSIVAGPDFLLFTEVVGIDDGLYVWRAHSLMRLTSPSEFPSDPSYGDGYVAWWGDSPGLLDLRTDQLYRVPGQQPVVHGDILTYLTPQGLHWLRLPPP